MTKYATFDAGPRDAPTLHPYDTASWLSRTMLSWVTPLMTLGNHKQLDPEDIWPLQYSHQAGELVKTFSKDYDASKSLVRAFFGSFGVRFLLTGFGSFAATAGTLVGPLVLNKVVTELTTDTYNVQVLTTWIVGLFVTQVVQALAETHSNLGAEVMSIQLTASLKNLIFAKSLRLNADSRREKTATEITNLYTTDCEFISECAIYIHQAWIIPLQILSVAVLLYRFLGVASIAGFAVIAVALFANHFVSTRFLTLYAAFMQLKDARMQALTEAFKSINIVKFNAWEDKCLQRIGEARTNELENVWSALKLIAGSVVILWGVPVLVSVATFSVYVGVLHETLTPATVFTSIALFQLIQNPLRDVADIVASIGKAHVAQKRIAAFLEMSEIDTDNVHSIQHPDANQFIKQNIIVAIQNATFAWDNDTPILKNVNLNVHAGDFLVIHGPVGCGKSSLCAALLGDMNKTSGGVYVGGSVAYCSQQAWIQHMTVRDNILFGRPYDRKKYEKVLEACALTKDLQSLPAGDRTEIGERGVNLSGGQKARVALARACYSDASVFILDAPLSAVDAIVQNEIFEKCLLGLLRHRTIILVTHNPEIIASEHVTSAVTLNDKGELVETRKVKHPSRPQYDSAITPLALLAYTRPSYDDEIHHQHEEHHHLAESDLNVLDMAKEVTTPSSRRGVEVNSRRPSFVEADEADEADETHVLVQAEERSQGRVGLHVFVSYYHAIGGFPVLFIVITSQVLWQVLQVSSDLWLSQWTTRSSSPEGDTMSQSSRIGIYAALGLSSALMVVVRMLTLSWFGIGAAKRLFDRMVYSLMHAPMKFFDANPIGRIIARFSNDVTDVDMMVPLVFGSFFANLLVLSFTMGTTAVIIQWKGLLLIPVMIIYVQVGRFYLEPAREIKRVERTTSAPVLSHLSECVDGGAVIRAFGTDQVLRFHFANDSKLDSANKVVYARLCVAMWFSLRIQLLGSLLAFISSYSLVLLHKELSPAIVGLAFSYVLKFSYSMERIVKTWSSVETTMVSPERMQQYIDIEQEAPHKIPTFDPPASTAWPSAGAIQFENVSFRYKDADQLVLKNLSFFIQGGEKIGIVGRTGAGKSSLTMALFRINELAGGSVLIDDVDVGKIGLKTLREKLSIIPQNPVLFKGPLRRYLDPFDEYTDDALWNALRRVGLIDRITSEDDKLECMVEENGENFSVGERQMLCMCRALLRESRIVIFDEATAAIDHETDQKLQRVIREAFVGSTVLTIAHRLDTILDADRILVLDGGEVVSFACPSELVSAGSGHFYDLMREGGYLDKFRTRGTTA
ncbi:hypothetical protein Poli38472_007595 [Pythium oligandrum]|uniref:Uncharacterized protein n=1 Tax=Pythium oligandrum TaxID=41045 RepID=A0A8K1CS21_PYTOL|nr:hypothetical protein Poli38472_007595 [Pythium oligandrum]|eukprot:TMW67923.1 hypothetical protein Poli38472_007595 [Pythium oligandrum]